MYETNKIKGMVAAVKPLKILHLSSPGFGGVDSYIFSHYKYMNREAFQFDFLTQNKGLANAEQYRGFQYKVKLLPAPDKSHGVFRKKVSEAFKEGYDVLHLHTGYWKGVELEQIAKEMRIPKVIVHSHCDFIDVADRAQRAALLKRHEEIKQIFSAELATDFWACSWKAADWLFGPQIPRNKIRILKNAIELDRFQFDQAARDSVRTRLGADQDTLVFGTAGRLTYQKNHEFLIKVFRNFHMRHSNSKLIMIGDGELRGDLEAQIRESGLQNSVFLLGWKNNVEDYLSAMDLFLFPSRFEALGIAAVEASASGLPCILSDQVSQDVAFTEHVRYVPLNIHAWDEALEGAACQKADRRAGVEAVRAAGYDVREQAKVLESLYMEA